MASRDGAQGRPPPPITVSVPGRGEAPAELLAVGPPVARTPRRPAPRSELLVAALGVLVLIAGLGTAQQRRNAPPPARVFTPPPGINGVTASTGLAPGGDLFVKRLSLSVQLAALPSRGDSGSPTSQDLITLVGARLAGFRIVLADGGYPRRLGPTTRRAQQVELLLEVSVEDCSVNTLAPRLLTLRVQRGSDPDAPVVAEPGDGVARLLDDLVRSTCRRPRG